MTVRVAALARKEVRHILRDPQSLAIILLLPVFMMFLYGYALNLDPREIPVWVEDPVQTPGSRAVASRLDATSLFRVAGVSPGVAHPDALFRSRDVRALFRLGTDFDADLHRSGRPARVQVLIDGSDPNLATIIRNAAGGVFQDAVLDLLHMPRPRLVDARLAVLYNPEQKSPLYFVPGLMALILLLISTLLTSVAIVREKETGTLEQLLVSPLRPPEIIAGKIIPYVVLAACEALLILGVGYLAFDLRVKGSLAFLAGTSLIYIFTGLSLGLLISTVAKRQQHAMMVALGATLMPSVILSGFIFPVASMPPALQALSHVIPATWFLEIVRGVVLKGVGLRELWDEVLALSAEGLLLAGLATAKFRSKL